MSIRIALFFVLGGLILGSDLNVDYQRLHRDAIVADLHCDTAMRLRRGADLSHRDSSGQVDLPRLIEGGVDLQAFACWLPTSTPIEKCRAKADEMIDSLESQVALNSAKIGICRTAAEAESLFADGKIAAFLAIENGVAIANDLDNLDHFYNRGVRYMTLTHSESNDWCISSGDTLPAFSGLTEFGLDVVRRMNKLGMIIDISHASADAVSAVLGVSKSPIIASHSCVYNICPHERNLTDEQIKAIAENGGLIGINFYNSYLSTRWNEVIDSIKSAHRAEIDSIESAYKNDIGKQHMALASLYREMGLKAGTNIVDVGTVVDHIDYIVRLVGPDYVALGSDFDGVYSFPNGLSDASMMPNITRELVKRGYSEDDIGKILGGNFMRLFRKVCV